jgi:hypothetical protein
MKKIFAVLAVLSLPLAALAADSKTVPSNNAAAPKHAASAGARSKHQPAVQPTSAADKRAEVKASKDHGSKMGACRAEATTQQLSGQAYKDAVTACMKK